MCIRDRWRGEQNTPPRQFQIHQSAPSGQRFTFSAKRPTAEPESGLAVSQYLARRVPDSGWQSKAISPPLTMPAAGSFVMLADHPFQLFSEDPVSYTHLTLP